MRLGVIVRADRRGLAYQSGELYRALKPDVTVAVDMRQRPAHERWIHDFDQYPDAIVTTWPESNNRFNRRAVEALLSCDVIYSAETFYDDRLMQLANKKRIATVRHVNCELYWSEGESHPIYPTTWRLPGRPEGPTVPVPIPDDRIAEKPAGDGLLLHVGGWKAKHDRNGTQMVRNTLRRTDRPWRITAQYGRAVGNDPNVEVMTEVEDRWAMYEGCSVLVMPRKYGGLCLPAQEAAARGLALVMTDTAPQNGWPIVPLAVRKFTVKARHVSATDLFHADPRQIAEVVDGLVGDTLTEAQERALGWAQSLAWSKWAPIYRKMFEKAAEEMT